VDNIATAWSARITAKEKGERLNLGHERLSDAGGGSGLLCFRSETRAIAQGMDDKED